MKLRLVSHLSQPLVKVTTQRHITSNQCRFDVNITSKRRKENNDKFPITRHFDVLFLYNFGERKIDIVSTNFIRRNFDEQNIDVVSMYFLQPDFAG